MKRTSVIQYLTLAGCQLTRESQSHSLWTDASIGAVQTVPKDVELSDRLGAKICRGLGKDSRVPDVSAADVRRVIERDFPIEQRRKVQNLLESQSSPLWAQDSGKYRIFLAILKLARGVIDDVARQIQVANLDPRDVMGFAEYPRFMRIGFVGAEKLDAVARQKLRDDDYQDYLNWLTAK